jgi:hypothetical protein
MEITLTIPDSVAARMLGDARSAPRELAELAGYSAYVSGRISEYEFGQLLGLNNRFDVHAILKRLQTDIDEADMDVLQQDVSLPNVASDALKAG